MQGDSTMFKNLSSIKFNNKPRYEWYMLNIEMKINDSKIIKIFFKNRKS